MTTAEKLYVELGNKIEEIEGMRSPHPKDPSRSVNLRGAILELPALLQIAKAYMLATEEERQGIKQSLTNQRDKINILTKKLSETKDNRATQAYPHILTAATILSGAKEQTTLENPEYNPHEYPTHLMKEEKPKSLSQEADRIEKDLMKELDHDYYSNLIKNHVDEPEDEEPSREEINKWLEKKGEPSKKDTTNWLKAIMGKFGLGRYTAKKVLKKNFVKEKKGSAYLWKPR